MRCPRCGYISPEPHVITPLDILDKVCRHYGVHRKEVRDTSQMARVVLPRHVTIYLIRKHTKWTFAQVSKWIGYAAAPSSIHGYQSIENRMVRDTQLRASIEIIEYRLLNVDKIKPAEAGDD